MPTLNLRTDHPVLVYKTYEFSGTVLRLFSCLPPSSTLEHTIQALLYFLALHILLLYIVVIILNINYLHLKYIVVPRYCL